MYAIRQDIIDRYGADALTVAADRNGDGIEDVGVVDKALADATTLIDSYLVERYALPLPQIPAVLILTAVDIAFYRLCQSAAALTDEIKDRNALAVRWLRDVADGRAGLGLAAAPPSTGGGLQVVSNERRFTRDKLRGI